MMKSSCPAVLLVGLSLGMQACGSGGGTVSELREGSGALSSTQARFSYSQRIHEIQESYWSEDCDRKDLEAKLAIAAELERRDAEILRAAERLELQGAREGLFRWVRLKPTILKQDVAPAVVSTQWSFSHIGWEDIFREFEALQGSEVDRRWVSLQRNFNRVLEYDASRVLNLTNMSLGRDGGKLLARATKEVSDCLSKRDCTDFPFSNSVTYMLSQNHFYRSKFADFHRTDDPAARRAELTKFANYLSGDEMRYRFSRNGSVYRKGPKELVLPLRTTDFERSKRSLQILIESNWSRKGNRLTVEWLDATSSVHAYTLVFENLRGVPDDTRALRKELVLHPRTSVGSLIHEVGHVLGFKDQQYPVWMPEECRYRVETNPSNIMSNPVTGGVLPEHWDILNEQYR